MVELLVSHGAQINCSVESYVSLFLQSSTPLILALKEGRYKIADLLLRKGANPNAADETNKTAIMYASLAAQYCLVESLLEHGADAKSSSHWGSPVQALARHRPDSASDIQNLIRTCRLLLDSGGDVNATPSGPSRMTALQLAIDCGTQELVEIFLEADANIHAPAFLVEGKTALQAAASTGNFKLVKRLVEMGADVNASPAETGGATALQYAAYSGHVNMAIFLLENGAAINALGSLSRGLTALQGASKHGRLDMIHLLLENDQDPDTVEERCRNSAVIAEKEGFMEISKFLRGYKRP
jgi:ankyrin repeat protein